VRQPHARVGDLAADQSRAVRDPRPSQRAARLARHLAAAVVVYRRAAHHRARSARRSLVGKTYGVTRPEVVITSPDKVMFADRGETKADLAAYYEAVEVPLMATMGGRPLLLQRYPNGASGPSFFQKRV